MLSLDLQKAPLLVSVVEGSRGSITSQIAVQLSAKAILNRALDFYAAYATGEVRLEGPLATAVVREAFKQANHEVYTYAHRMGASGRVAATGFVAVYDGSRISVARVGRALSYILRDGELVSLYRDEAVDALEQTPGVLERFIGANAQILVDLASVEVRKGDVILLANVPGGAEFAQRAQAEFARDDSLESAVHSLGYDIAGAALKPSPDGMLQIDRTILVVAFRVGGPLIRLTQVIS